MVVNVLHEGRALGGQLEPKQAQSLVDMLHAGGTLARWLEVKEAQVGRSCGISHRGCPDRTPGDEVSLSWEILGCSI